MVKEEFQKILEDCGYESIDVEELWNSRPPDFDNEPTEEAEKDIRKIAIQMYPYFYPEKPPH